MLKAAIVGCGRIADSHAAQIQLAGNCEIVAVCDREELMARQFARRFGGAASYDRLDQLLRDARPDVVHITTPPTSHFELTRSCLEYGCHVYVEKPFTLNTEDAAELFRIAQQQDLKLTVGHDDQFRHAARRMRELIQ